MKTYLTKVLIIVLLISAFQIPVNIIKAQSNPQTTGPIGSQIAYGINEDIKYWNGNAWIAIPSGLPGQNLTFNNNIPAWTNNPNGITTNTATPASGTTATCGGYIASSSGSPITARGVCWSMSHYPSIYNFHTTDDIGKGSFTSTLTGLSTGATYYVRAYATNSAGTVYGNEVSFVAIDPAKVYDFDGNAYDTVKIGTQYWLKQNLKTTHYRNGDAIPNVTDNTAWSALTTGAYCNYNNDANNGNVYGRLYNYYTVADPRNLCPTNWHVSSDADWTVLNNYLGGSTVAGAKLKETGTTHWLSPNTGATNQTGFTAVPGGYRFIYGAFNYLGTYSQWWTSTEANATNSYYYYIVNNGIPVYTTYYNKAIGFSVRCVKD